jgi:hypothetical protein
MFHVVSSIRTDRPPCAPFGGSLYREVDKLKVACAALSCRIRPPARAGLTMLCSAAALPCRIPSAAADAGSAASFK